MNKSEVIVKKELTSIIGLAINGSINCVMSYMSKGKWYRLEVLITALNRKALSLLINQQDNISVDLQVDQPVGITFEADQIKYLFESKVIGFDSAINDGKPGNILIKQPLSIEKMQRRSYTRVPVPNKLKVKTLFWHRGYTDNSCDTPLDNYWQGRMMDLSAGGTQIKVTREQYENFREGQIIGMQFTPLPYEKPVLVEGQIKHIAVKPDDQEMISLGIEFMGLEASTDGRIKLDRIVETIRVYQQQQNPEAAETLASEF